MDNLNPAVQCLCYCALLPIIIPFRITISIHDVARRKKASWKNDVRPLPPKRKRRLSNEKLPPLSSSSIFRPQGPWAQTATSNKPLCSFLIKLPLEIRLQIYEYVLGGNLLHLIQIPRRIAHVRCREMKSADPLRGCRPALRTPLNSMLCTVSNGNLALLKTCRQIYREGIEVLYAGNAFDVNDLTTFMFFARSILPHRLASITTLHLSWDLTSNVWRYGHVNSHQLWKKFWRVVADEMHGLRELVLRLKRGNPGVKISRFEPWVRPMCEVRGLRSARVEVEHEKKEEAEARKLVKYLEKALRGEAGAFSEKDGADEEDQGVVGLV